MSNEVIEATAEVIEPSNALEVTYTPAVLADNLEALNAFVEQQIAPYVGAKIDPNDYEQVKMARKCMADLNKLKDPIDKERKRVKREYETPLKEFEGRVKAITAKIDGARAALKVQVDEADERFREMRRALLVEEYEGCAGPIADVIPFAAILEDAWLNRSTPETKAVNELYEKVEKALKGYKTLQTKELNHKDEVVKHYAHTLDLIAALELEDRLNERDREMAEFKAAQEAARLVAEERNAPEPEPEPEPQAAPAAPERFSWALSMEFEGTKEFATSVAHALKGLGLTGASIVCTGVIGHD
ncbi:DUF1351 domain-containing protein [Adlercreutzia equolifaciens]|uniref:DUF1351 domain-containing protein n=1 Tax=Adlercreutzia equolifaciens TaxID=446660 RepID=A0A6L8QA36_9ACTN|nr:DUF1351 domain-containing protein [Adlercreutzia equolifaciens]MZG28865.1 DUF1351 domain-containing protein [Adlercreutzia equolifaciens]